MTNEKDFVIEKGVLTKYTGNGGDVVIPEGVKKIGKRAFLSCKTLTGVTMPDSVTEIEESAFECCENLAEINISKGIKEIGKYAFEHCLNLKIALVIPESMERIGSYAFSQCGITSVNIPASTVDINDAAFFNDHYLSAINVDKNNKVYASADGVLFSKDMKKLLLYPLGITNAEYTVPESVEMICNGAFRDNYNIKSVTIPGNVREIDGGAFMRCGVLAEVKISNGVTKIGGGAFGMCKSLKNVIIPDSINTIGEKAFMGCNNIKNLDIPKNTVVESAISDNIDIERYFVPNIDLSKINNPEDKFICVIHFLSSADSHSDKEKEMYTSYIKKQKKKIIGEIIEKNIVFALKGILDLNIITVKDVDSFIELTNNAGKTEMLSMLMEYKNKNFTSAEVEKESNRKINKELNYNPKSVTEMKKIWLFDDLPDGTLILTNYKGTDTEIVIPDHIGDKKVTVLGEKLFSVYKSRINNEETREKIKSIIIPEGITEIGDGAFSGCKKLADITIPNSVARIGENAFDECGKLINVIIPLSVKEIGYGAFMNCTRLADVTISGADTRIEERAFYGCKNLTVHAPAGSFAEEYAKNNRRNFIPMEEN